MNSRAKQLQERIATVPYWFHSIDLGDGVTTPGYKDPAIHAQELRNQRWPDLQGKSVLDIGACDGYYSFEAERRGATRVVALDYYGWDTDLTVAKDAHVKHDVRGTIALGRGGFDVAHDALGSRVTLIVDDFTTMDVSTLGRFDVVLFLGVLYHLRDPLDALRRLALVTREVAIVETVATVVPGWEHHAFVEFFEGADLGEDPSNWWSPTARALHGMLRATGFSSIEDTAGPGESGLTHPREIARYRHSLHARRDALRPRIASI